VLGLRDLPAVRACDRRRFVRPRGAGPGAARGRRGARLGPQVDDDLRLGRIDVNQDGHGWHTIRLFRYRQGVGVASGAGVVTLRNRDAGRL
jgi:hypothetical protein